MAFSVNASYLNINFWVVVGYVVDFLQVFQNSVCNLELLCYHKDIFLTIIWVNRFLVGTTSGLQKQGLKKRKKGGFLEQKKKSP